MAILHWHAISMTILSESRSVFDVRGIKDSKRTGAAEMADSRRAKEPGGSRQKGRKFKRFDSERNAVTSNCKGEKEKQMSARHITWVEEVNPEDLLLAENIQLKQLNQEMKKNLDGLEQGVHEVKVIVRKTQSKMDKLEASIDKIEEPDKES